MRNSFAEGAILCAGCNKVIYSGLQHLTALCIVTRKKHSTVIPTTTWRNMVTNNILPCGNIIVLWDKQKDTEKRGNGKEYFPDQLMNSTGNFVGGMESSKF